MSLQPQKNVGSSLFVSVLASKTSSTTGLKAKKPLNLANLEKHMKKKSIGLLIKKKKSQSALQFYKEICSKLNCQINSVISHGLKENDLFLNVDNLLPSDLNPLKVLLPQCEFESVSLIGNKEFDAHEIFSSSHKNDSGEISARESFKNEEI